MGYKILDKCRICSSTNLRSYLNLGAVPLANSLKVHSKKYPIEVLYCEDCSLSQLSIVVNAEFLYHDYPYHSSVSKTFRSHCKDMATHIKKAYEFKNNPPSVLDIASNDGCLLKEFREEGFVVRGFEPCVEMTKKLWEEDKIFCRPQFFNKQSSLIARSWSGEDVITATNVLAHIDDLVGFIEGIKYQIESNPKAIFIAEFPYFANLIKNNQFDTIYHEHLSYFLVKPLIKLFSDNGLPIFKIEHYPIHGGSLRIYASQGYYPNDISIGTFLEYEESSGLYDYYTYQSISNKVMDTRINLVKTLLDIQSAGKKVMGYGASAKGISLLNYCGINNKLIDSIVDETPEKQWQMTPGSNIPIVDFKQFDKKKPDYILLLAWNFAEELMFKTSYLGAKYIIPIPEVKVT